jgi:hypothetical protein
MKIRNSWAVEHGHPNIKLIKKTTCNYSKRIWTIWVP